MGSSALAHRGERDMTANANFSEILLIQHSKHRAFRNVSSDSERVGETMLAGSTRHHQAHLRAYLATL
jgi:hypothetical protein